MRFSTVIVAALFAATPALSYAIRADAPKSIEPKPTSVYHPHGSHGSHRIRADEPKSIEPKPTSVSHPQGYPHDIKPAHARRERHAHGGAKHSREIDDVLELILRRQVADVDGSGASIWGTLAKDAGSLIGDFTGGSSNNNNRRQTVDGSGASIWGTLAKDAGSLIGDFTGGSNNNNNNRRQTVDGSGASIWGTLAKDVGSLVGDFTGGSNSDSNNRRSESVSSSAFGRRELELLEMLLRREAL